MSQDSGVLDITFKSAENLSGSPYCIVKMGDATTPHAIEITTAETDKPIGILQNAPKLGENAVVRVLGTSKLELGTPIASPIGTYLVAGADGRARPIAEFLVGTPHTIGIALEGDGTSAGDIIEVLIDRNQFFLGLQA